MLTNTSLIWLVILALPNCAPLWAAAGAAEDRTAYSNSFGPANGLLIFLDDSEGAKGSESFTIGSALLAAILQGAGPIVASGALLAGLKEFSAPSELDPVAQMLQYYGLSTDTPENNLTRKNILLSAANLHSLLARNWVIKQVNPELYLLIPNQYLAIRNIKSFNPEPDVLARQFLLQNGNAELAELALGLKVNHMPTITFDEIRRPATVPQFANYFIVALRENQLFVTNHDYYLANQAARTEGRITVKFPKIPSWSIYLAGHGLINYSIAHLSPAQFKEFLDLIENKINARLLYYMSCYAAGVNSELIYKNLTTGINQTYSYAIITQALTDATTFMPGLGVNVVRGALQIDNSISYSNFLAQVTINSSKISDTSIDSSSKIDYQKIAVILNPTLAYTIGYSFNNTSQIKFPGIPWFSVLDNQKVVSIGEILAKTHTAPLDVATFFAKTDPLAILLYTPNIPFELIVNTRAPSGEAPAIISMLPGDAMHHLKQLTSNIYPTEQFLNSFLQLDGLKPQKIFLIDQLTYAPKTAAPHTVKNALIVLRETEQLVYFEFAHEIYKSVGKIKAANPARLANPTEQTEYHRILAQYRTVETATITPEFMRDLQVATDLKFSHSLTVAQAIQNITDTLNSMPNNSVLYVTKIDGIPYSAAHNTPWLDLITSVAQYKAPAMPAGTRKILWIDHIDAGRKTATGHDILEYTDIIIDCNARETKVYFKINRARPQKLVAGTYSTASSYVPLFDELLAYFRTHTSLPENLDSLIDTRAIQALLTSESMSKLQAVQARKLEDFRAGRYPDTSPAPDGSSGGGGGAKESKSTTPDQDGPDTESSLPTPVTRDDYKILLDLYKTSNDSAPLIAIYTGFNNTGKNEISIIRYLGAQLNIANKFDTINAKLKELIIAAGGRA